MTHFLINQCIAILTGYSFLTWTRTQPQDRLGTACLSYVSGTCIFGTLSYLFDFFLTPIQSSLIASAICLLVAGIGVRFLNLHKWMGRPDGQIHLWRLRNLTPILLGLVLCTLLWRIASLVVFFDLDGALFVAHDSNYGDISIHLQLANFFLTNPPFPPEAPYFANTPLRYPFLVDYVAALASPQGNLVTHMQIQSFLLFICCFGAIRSVTRQLFPSDGSKKTQWIYWLAPLLVFTFEPGLEAYLAHGGNLFTSKIDGIDVLSIFYAHFISQRGMLLGFPLALGVFASVHRHILNAPQHTAIRTVVWLSILSSLIFLAYAFCFIWLLLLCISYTLPLRKNKIYYAILTGLLSCLLGLMLYPAMFGWHEKIFTNAFRFFLLWTAPKTFLAATAFWTMNLGIVGILTLIIGFRIHWKLTITALIAWMATNLFQLRPWMWDNTKMLVLTLTCMCILVCGILLHLQHKKRYVLMSLVLLLWLFDYSRGIWRVYALTQKNYLEVLPVRTVQLANELRPPPPNQVLLYESTHRHPCVLAGCVLFQGYPGHSFSLGLEGWYHRQKIAEETLAKTGKSWLWIPRNAIIQHDINLH